VLNEEGYSYGIKSSINLQILQLESHGYQLSGAKNRTVQSCLVQILLQREFEKVVKNLKKSLRTVKCKKKFTYFCTYLRNRLLYTKNFNRFGFSRQGLYFEKKYIKINATTRIQL
jgi:hypothetical protein